MTHFRLSKALTLVVACVLGLAFTASTASAMPAFARKEHMKCSTCHTVWPLLNAFGRTYKENGYQVTRGRPSNHTKISDALTLPKVLPLALVINSRPYDRKKNGQTKIRALHELELLAGGNYAGWGSFFAELSSEDEGDFTTEIESAVAGLHLNQYVNVVLGKSRPFFADPYNILHEARKFTRANSALITAAGNSGVDIGSTIQNVEVYGRAGKVFYMAGIGADTGDPEGSGADNFAASVVADVLPTQLSIGAFVYNGRQRMTTDLNPVSAPGTPILQPNPALMIGSNVDFSRYGITLQGQIGDLNYQAAGMKANEDLVNASTGMVSGDETNYLYQGEVFYKLHCDSMKDAPIPVIDLVPFARIENSDNFGASGSATNMVLNLTALHTENFRSSLEWAQTLKGPDDNRVTFYLVFGI